MLRVVEFEWHKRVPMEQDQMTKNGGCHVKIHAIPPLGLLSCLHWTQICSLCTCLHERTFVQNPVALLLGFFNEGIDDQ